MVVARTDWFSFHLVSHRSAVSTSALNVSSLIQLHQCSDWTPTSVLPPMEGSSSPINILVFPPSFFILPSLEVLYILFHWSGTPVSSQMLFKHFCVWRCIPDVSVERDVLHAHLLICHLALRDYLSVYCDQFFCGAYMSECHHGSGSWYGVPYSVLARYKQWFSCHKGLLSLIHPSGGRLINEKF